ncbi:MAG: hypothetical protein HYX79_06200 [Chloroflexi bacterium]|nr:hypothetical protein [Chloroflexota bacterium]
MNLEYPALQPFHKSIFSETASDPVVAKDIEFVCGFFEDWVGEFLHPIGDDLHRANKPESVLYCYMASQSLVFDWLCHSVLLGNYETVLRELRSILEGLFLTFYLDSHYQDDTVQAKYRVMEQLEFSNRSHGKVVFERTGYSGWKSSYELYKKLCKYVHTSTEVNGMFVLEVSKKGFPEALESKYSGISFLRCSKAWRQVSMAAVSLVECLFEQLRVDQCDFNPNYLREVWSN